MKPDDSTISHLPRSSGFPRDSHFIASWFHIDEDGVGVYAQVTGTSSGERFRDIYRRCIGLFYVSARRANPHAELLLYTNKAWDPEVSPVASEVHSWLQKLGVTLVVVPYSYEPPASFTRNWRNQFYVFDVLQDLNSRAGTGGTFTILDSDVLWLSQSMASQLWMLTTEKFATLELQHDPDVPENGLSGRQLADLLDVTNAITYCGGEVIFGPIAEIPAMMRETNIAFEKLSGAHRQDHSISFEEAHILSAAYSNLPTIPFDQKIHIKRMWTQPFRYKNIDRGDENIALWHIPAEKQFGLRRLYRAVQKQGVDWAITADDARWKKTLSRKLGVPRNTTWKIFLDITAAMIRRLENKMKSAA